MLLRGLLCKLGKDGVTDLLQFSLTASALSFQDPPGIPVPINKSKSFALEDTIVRRAMHLFLCLDALHCTACHCSGSLTRCHCAVPVCCCCRPIDEGFSELEGLQGCFFRVLSRHKSFYVHANSPLEKDRWMEAISSATRWAHVHID